MITVERVKLGEIPQVKKVLSRTWKDTYGSFYSDEAIRKITSSWHSPKVLTAQAKDPKFYFAVAKDKKRNIVGLITVRKLSKDAAFMGRLYVDPSYQRKGIGMHLLKSALRHFSGIKTMKLECEKQNNKACAFYLKQGFKVVGEKGETVEGVTMKTVVMEKKFGRHKPQYNRGC
ncbi:GNAT family N-acetyltransferase [Candidatus Roizmanbacteria bacterium]|nr:GNAT family N-acetyltransferase [Candidatus Roizmanbacteria bacterium]